MALKTIPLVIMMLVFLLLSRTTYFTEKSIMLYLVVGQVLLTSAFNLFNIYRFERDSNSQDFLLMNARFSQYIAIFFVDIVLIAVFMLTLILLRHAELEVLVKLGVYKNVENMSDKEMFQEYDKLKKQSLKLQKRLRKAQRRVAKKSSDSVRLSVNQEDDTMSEVGDNDSIKIVSKEEER